MLFLPPCNNSKKKKVKKNVKVNSTTLKASISLSCFLEVQELYNKKKIKKKDF